MRAGKKRTGNEIYPYRSAQFGSAGLKIMCRDGFSTEIKVIFHLKNRILLETQGIFCVGTYFNSAWHDINLT